MSNAKNSNRFMLALLIWTIPAGLIVYALTYHFFITTGMLLFLSQALIFGIPCIIVFIANRKRIKEILPIKKMGIINILLIIVMSIVIQPLLMFISSIMSLLTPNIIADVMVNMNRESHFLLVLVFIAVVPAVFEELVFRGIIFAGYKEVPIFKAALLNGLLFGIIHLNMQQFLYAAILGFILCYFVFYTKSIISAVLAHFVLNGTQAGLGALLLNSQQDIAPYNEPSMLMTIVITGVAGAVGLAIFLAVYKKFKSHNTACESEVDVVPEGTDPPTPSEQPKLFTAPVYISIALFVVFVVLTFLPQLLHG